MNILQEWYFHSFQSNPVSACTHISRCHSPHRLETHAAHLIVLCTVFEDKAHIVHKLLYGLVVLGAPQLQLLLHPLQVHGLLNDLVVVRYLGLK